MSAARGLAVMLTAGLALAFGARQESSASADLREGTTLARDHVKLDLRGFDVRVHPELLEGATHADVGARALDALDRDLGDLVDQLPAAATTKLREVPLFLGVSDPVAPCACYHPSARWLASNGYDPAKARSVEISNARHYVAWRLHQPSLVLHELAHAYHDRQHRAADGRLRAALKAAREAGRYDRVLRSSGARDSHYAMTNIEEYFAETTEALFGTNDFAPFVRAELMLHDPVGARLTAELWGKDEWARPREDATMEQLIRDEVAEMHARFERWFGGSGGAPESDADMDAVEAALGPAFVMVTPTGALMERGPLVERLRAAGGKRQVRLTVEVLRVDEVSPTRAMAVYHEHQSEGGDERTIVSTALFERDGDAPGGVRWLHVHETYLAK